MNGTNNIRMQLDVCEQNECRVQECAQRSAEWSCLTVEAAGDGGSECREERRDELRTSCEL